MENTLTHTAIKAAKAAGEVLKHFYTQPLNISKKSSETDLVTQADLAAEETVVQTILNDFPDHAMWTEENGQSGTADYVWLIDPLDGTTNFVHRFPHFCTAIALFHHDKLKLAVTYDPLRDELFVAHKGGGVTLNGVSVTVNRPENLRAALVSTGFPYKGRKTAAGNLPQFSQVMPHVQGIRRSGSASLDTAYVACGRLDGYWEYHLSPWDWMGGALMIAEAGGRVTDTSGNPWGFSTTSIIAGSDTIWQDLYNIISNT